MKKKLLAVVLGIAMLIGTQMTAMAAEWDYNFYPDFEEYGDITVRITTSTPTPQPGSVIQVKVVKDALDPDVRAFGFETAGSVMVKDATGRTIIETSRMAGDPIAVYSNTIPFTYTLQNAESAKHPVEISLATYFGGGRWVIDWTPDGRMGYSSYDGSTFTEINNGRDTVTKIS